MERILVLTYTKRSLWKDVGNPATPCVRWTVLPFGAFPSFQVPMVVIHPHRLRASPLNPALHEAAPHSPGQPLLLF